MVYKIVVKNNKSDIILFYASNIDEKDSGEKKLRLVFQFSNKEHSSRFFFLEFVI